MNREFLLNITLLIAINLVVKPFYIFGIDRTIQNTLPEGVYGLYFSLFGFTFLFQIVNDLGIQQYNSRRIAGRPFLLPKYFPKLLKIKLLLGALFLGFVFFFTLILQYETRLFPLLFFIALNHILVSFVLFFRSNIAALGFYRTDSLISALDKTLLILFCAILLWGGDWRADFRIEWFVWAQTLAWSLTAAVCLAVLWPHLSRVGRQIRDLRLFYVNRPLVIAILKQTYPYALVVFLMTLYTRIDGVMIERMLPDGRVQADIYAAAYRLLDAVNMIGFLFAGLLLPMFSGLLKSGKPVWPLVGLSWRVIWSGAVPIAFGVFLFRDDIMHLLYTNATPAHGTVMGYLILSFIAVSGIYIFSTLLTAGGNLRRMNQLFVIGILLNVGLNAALIPTCKAAGAALATLVTQVFIFSGKIFLCKKSFRLRFPPVLIFQFAGFALATWWLQNVIKNALTPDWTVKFLCAVAAGGLLAFVFRLIRPADIRAV